MLTYLCMWYRGQTTGPCRCKGSIWRGQNRPWHSRGSKRTWAPSPEEKKRPQGAHCGWRAAPLVDPGNRLRKKKRCIIWKKILRPPETPQFRQEGKNTKCHTTMGANLTRHFYSSGKRIIIEHLPLKYIRITNGYGMMAFHHYTVN